jgi:outer membrane protein assembly complex protein YaeT
MKATDRLPRLPRLLVVLASSLLGAAVCLAQQAVPGKVYVDDVIVQPPGDYGLPPGRIMSLIRTRAGNELNKATLDDDVRALFETKAFANVQVSTKTTSPGKETVYFYLTPLPSRVQEIVYQGAKHFSDDDLNKAVGEFGLRRGMPLSPIANESARQAILKLYEEKARMFASVQIVEGNKAGDTRVVFSITEGPKVKVRYTTFTGNDFVPDGRLRTQLNTSRTFLPRLGGIGGDFNPGMVDNDCSIIEKYFKSFGFQDATCTRELQWSEDHRFVDIVFHVHEGQRYRVADVQVMGNKTYANDRLLDMVRSKPGEYYDNRVVQADENAIKNFYGYDGREATVKEDLVFAPGGTPGEVAVHYEIIERPPATVGQIIIIGNTTTREQVIRRQLDIFPGQVLSYPNLRTSEAKLARLNIFEVAPDKGIRPTLEVLDPDSDSPVKDVLVNVEETRTGSLMFGVGVNSDAGLTGSIVLNERNFDILRPPTSLDDLLSGRAFRGGGQEFRLEAVPGTQLQRYTASWREPFLFDSQYSLGVSGYYYDRSFNEDTESRLGGRITVGRQITPQWSVSGSLRIEQVGIHNVLPWAPVDYLSVIGENSIIGLRGSVTRDTRDSFLRPTQGNMIQASFEQVVGDYTFPLATLEANQYFTIWERADNSGRHVLALRSMLGYAGSHTPVFERYYAGGFQSMRGFEFRGVGPDIDGFMVGGDFMFLNSAEYQIPILANDQLYAVAFVDSGTVESKVEIQSYRVSAGVGLRIVVPMLGPVPIALDFGFPIVKESTDRTQMFSFWLGFFH